MDAAAWVGLAGVALAIVSAIAGIVWKLNQTQQAHTDQKIESLESHVVSDIGEVQMRFDKAEKKSAKEAQLLHDRISGLGKDVRDLEREFRRGSSELRERVVRIETKVLNGK